MKKGCEKVHHSEEDRGEHKQREENWNRRLAHLASFNLLVLAPDSRAESLRKPNVFVKDVTA